MPRAKDLAGHPPAALTPSPAAPAAKAEALADSSPVPEGSVRVLGQAATGEPALKQEPARVQPVDELVPVMIKPSGEDGSFTAGFHRNPKYPDPALAPVAKPVVSAIDPRQGVHILGASPSMAREKVNVLF